MIILNSIVFSIPSGEHIYDIGIVWLYNLAMIISNHCSYLIVLILDVLWFYDGAPR